MAWSSESGLISALHSQAPAADRAEKLMLYGWLIGDWTMDVQIHDENGGRRRGRGEIHFGWVLEGRAIQDVWVTPPRADRQRGMAVPEGFYGTTLRVYDPGLDAWHILWIDPVKQLYSRMIGRAEGRDIVQLGEDNSGARLRWSFTEITADSFHWLGERASAGDADYRPEVEFFARRAPAA